jgi:hypothetical protein
MARFEGLVNQIHRCGRERVTGDFNRSVPGTENHTFVLLSSSQRRENHENLLEQQALNAECATSSTSIVKFTYVMALRGINPSFEVSFIKIVTL